MFRVVEHNKVALDIIAQIRGAILNGTLNPGDKLPSERHLVTKFGVSKHTLREAIRALETMGLLEVRKGVNGGAVVLEVDMQTTKDSIANFLYFKDVSVHDLSEVRKLLEPYLARIAAERLSSEEVDNLVATHKTCEEAIKHAEPMYEQEIEFHRILARVSGNPVFMLIQDFVNSLLTESKQRLKPGLTFQEEVYAAHDRILQALVAKDPGLAASEMLRHVCEIEDSLVELRKQKNKENAAKLQCN